MRNGVGGLPRSTRRACLPGAVDVDRTLGLHPLLRRFNDGIGCRDDVGRGAVVCRQVAGPGIVIFFKPADELHRSALEGIDVLVVVSHGKEGEFAGVLVQAAPGQGRDQLVLIGINILVLVNQDPAETRQQLLPPPVGLLHQQILPPQHVHCATDHLLERCVVGWMVGTFQPPTETGACQPHGQPMAGEDGDAPGVGAKQRLQAAPDLDSSMTVVGQGHNAAGVFPSYADQVGDSVDQHPRLAGAGAGQHQHVGLLAVVGDNTLLIRILQVLNDGLP